MAKKKLLSDEELARRFVEMVAERVDREGVLDLYEADVLREKIVKMIKTRTAP